MMTEAPPVPVRWLDRAAAGLLAVEAVAIGALLVREVLGLVAGDAGILQTALALAVLTALGALAVAAFSIATWRGQSWGRSGGIVTQLLVLAVALGAATGTYADGSVALLLAVPALVTLAILLLAVRASAPKTAAGDAASD